jgi:hypothetical protein
MRAGTRKHWPVGVLAVLVTLMVVSNLVNYRATLRETTQPAEEPQQTGAQDQPVRYVVAQRLNTYRMVLFYLHTIEVCMSAHSATHPFNRNRAALFQNSGRT